MKIIPMGENTSNKMVLLAFVCILSFLRITPLNSPLKLRGDEGGLRDL